jgi:PRTRC genetic system ThiF family protein
MGFLNAATVAIPDFRMAQIILVGGGGIGAYMAQHIGRLMRVLYQSDKGVHLTIVDPDTVEEQNIGRQLFCDAEIGVPKAEALARRYGQAWGLNASYFVGRFDDSLLLGAEVTVLVGCVDNADARTTLAQTLMHNDGSQPTIWWLDSGNLRDTGRVLIGSAYSLDQLHDAFRDKNVCYAMPSPSMQSPGLLEAQPEEIGDPQMSCAQMAEANLQSLNINARIAAEAADILTRLIVTKDLKRFACEVNLAAGTVVSKYVTPEEVAGVIKRPVSFLTGGHTAEPRLYDLPSYAQA